MKVKNTIEMLDEMIRQADKGPSGFWVDDGEGCGNPNIFPEFEEGLRRGRLIQKEHYLCPWNTAVMYGNGRGNIHTGCYHSCSFEKAKFLSCELLKEILQRFKSNLIDGKYDDKENISPLLTAQELEYIEEQEKAQKQAEEEELRKARQAERLKKAASLVKKHPEHKDMFACCYGEKRIWITDEGGIILFDPESQSDVVGAGKMSYDEYLNVQIASSEKKHRSHFATLYYNIPIGFKGEIERMGKDDRICFKRIFTEGMFPDGVMFDGKEDHVWMDRAGFEEFQAGDSVKFFAEVYRYIKTGNGKLLDYGLRNPEEITPIPSYELPTDEELAEQAARQIICETCYLSEHCNRMMCMRQKETDQLVKQMKNALINEEEKS